MRPNILFVDDDRVLQRMVQNKLENYRHKFSVYIATDGVEAVQMLKNIPISVVVTDLQMPNMDGFGLLANISENFPDIPAIILTGATISDSQKAILERKYSGFIQKPIVFNELFKQIGSALRKQVDGGILKTFALETFVQLVEMEQKTCTIRAINKSIGKQGALFFKRGKLLDARIETLYGEQAAYEIFSWENITLTIQDTCPVKHKRITDCLQAIVMDALRLKDEALENELILERDQDHGSCFIEHHKYR